MVGNLGVNSLWCPRGAIGCESGAHRSPHSALHKAGRCSRFFVRADSRSPSHPLTSCASLRFERLLQRRLTSACFHFRTERSTQRA